MLEAPRAGAATAAGPNGKRRFNLKKARQFAMKACIQRYRTALLAASASALAGMICAGPVRAGAISIKGTAPGNVFVGNDAIRFRVTLAEKPKSPVKVAVTARDHLRRSVWQSEQAAGGTVTLALTNSPVYLEGAAPDVLIDVQDYRKLVYEHTPDVWLQKRTSRP